MSRETLFAVFFFVAFVFLLYQVFEVFSGFLVPAAWAAVLALVFSPVYRALLGSIGRSTVAAFLTTLMVYLLVIVPTLALSGVVIGQARRFYATVQEAVASGEAESWISRVQGSPPVRAVLDRLPPDVRQQVDARGLTVRAAGTSTEFVVAALGGIALNFFRFVIDFLIMILLLFFFFRDGPTFYRGLRSLLPMEVEHQDAIFSRLYDTISAVVQGMTITAATQAVLAFLGFWVLDVPFALLLGFATAVASFVPIGGATLVWVPCVIYFMAIGSWINGFLLLAWGAGVISLIDNFLKPWIIGDRTKIPTLFLFLGILGGIQAYGVIGVFLGPALLGIIIAFFRIYREEYSLPGSASERRVELP